MAKIIIFPGANGVIPPGTAAQWLETDANGQRIICRKYSNGNVERTLAPSHDVGLDDSPYTSISIIPGDNYNTSTGTLVLTGAYVIAGIVTTSDEDDAKFIPSVPYSVSFVTDESDVIINTSVAMHDYLALANMDAMPASGWLAIVSAIAQGG